MGDSPEWSARTRRQEERLPVRGSACVIEPDNGTRERVASLLRAMGFTAHETGSGELGEFIASQVRLNAIVLDLALPDVKGLLLIRRLRRRDPTVVIVALSAHAASAIPETLGRIAGADAVLAAPPPTEALCSAIAEAEHARRAWSPSFCAPHLNRV